jgi:hypothetical protein
MAAVSARNETSGLKNVRACDTPSTLDDVVYWSVDSNAGVIQGPLDLEFIRGKVLHLTLMEDQIALHFQEGQLRRIFMEGIHVMRVGRLEGDLPPESALVFLASDRPLVLQWHHGEAVWLPADEKLQTRLPIRGSCTCHISGPEPFYATFLSHAEHTGEPFTTGVISSLILSQIEGILREFLLHDNLQLDDIKLLARKLIPDDLNPNLASYGLLCSQLELTCGPASTTRLPQTSGQFEAVRDNRGP